MITIIATISHILRLKYTTFDTSRCYESDPSRGAYRSVPDPRARFIEVGVWKGRERWYVGREERELKEGNFTSLATYVDDVHNYKWFAKATKKYPTYLLT